jgi:hypothetical protein
VAEMPPDPSLALQRERNRAMKHSILGYACKPKRPEEIPKEIAALASKIEKIQGNGKVTARLLERFTK